MFYREKEKFENVKLDNQTIPVQEFTDSIDQSKSVLHMDRSWKKFARIGSIGSLDSAPDVYTGGQHSRVSICGENVSLDHFTVIENILYVEGRIAGDYLRIF